ncbi:MAG: hypothetical protein UT63_C0016G0018 [Candidatus Gottesmanbacteria bacterium GW2011_GWC2_39_8]|uniref:Uncharacterized protein n=1 Tax=Candidatus Gottesmanbacteria bacterium GW2011_GWC2_39_8 TaxID=1618450 RepID=A0A0G0PZD1_9BACT|nr:MAG: hypothetical protein UT63_C0016G0018 [Candidatus Gottesmanbacteria bacterium GW2011_GWC2_39_8]
MSPSKKARYLLLDSCIIEYLLDQYIHDPITCLLLSWSSKIFDLSISEITYSELIDGARPRKREKSDPAS